MRKFTESKITNTLKGWVLLQDNMRRVEFEINNGEFISYLDGDIWDYSEDPQDFCNVITNGVVYTKMENSGERVEYNTPSNLKQWIKINT